MYMGPKSPNSYTGKENRRIADRQRQRKIEFQQQIANQQKDLQNSSAVKPVARRNRFTSLLAIASSLISPRKG